MMLREGGFVQGFSAFLGVLTRKWKTVLERGTSPSEAFCRIFGSMLCDVLHTEHAGSGSLFLFLM